MKEKVWKVDSRKKAIYFNGGIFHSGAKSIPSRLIRIRRSHRKDKGYERIVFDFDTKEPPKIYGHLAGSENKLYVDFFASDIESTVKFPEGSQYASSANFLADAGVLSVEVNFKTDIKMEIFYLSSPGRVVMDFKK